MNFHIRQQQYCSQIGQFPPKIIHASVHPIIALKSYTPEEVSGKVIWLMLDLIDLNMHWNHYKQDSFLKPNIHIVSTFNTK